MEITSELYRCHPIVIAALKASARIGLRLGRNRRRASAARRSGSSACPTEPGESLPLHQARIVGHPFARARVRVEFVGLFLPRIAKTLEFRAEECFLGLEDCFRRDCGPGNLQRSVQLCPGATCARIVRRGFVPLLAGFTASRSPFTM
jgi:hypothetical protein